MERYATGDAVFEAEEKTRGQTRSTWKKAGW